MQTGTLIRWKDDSGFGFIAPDLGGDSIFVHTSKIDVRQRITAGLRVRFDTGESDRHPGRTEAKNVVVIGVAA